MRRFLTLFIFICFPSLIFCQGLKQYSLSLGLNGGCSYLKPKGSNIENWKYRPFPHEGLDVVLHNKWTRNREFTAQVSALYYNYNFKSQDDIYHAGFVYINVQLSLRKYLNRGFYKQLGIGAKSGLFQGSNDEIYKNFSVDIHQKNSTHPFLSPQMGVIIKSRRGGQTLWDIGVFYQIGFGKIGTALLNKNGATTKFISRGSYLGVAIQKYLITNKKNFNRGNNGLNKKPYPNKAICPRRS